MKYWIVVVSKDHSQRAMEGDFIQACNGKQAPLKRMKNRDWLIIYSSKISMMKKEPCQAFTAIGQVTDDDIYQFQMSDDFAPFRRNIKFYDCSQISILPLIHQLEFIQNKTSWGYPFRFGFLEIKENDFNLISQHLLQHETIR